MSSKTLLIILDGWGIAKDKKVSAIDQASPLYYDQLIKNHPNAKLITFGNDVGLPEGQMGNSEVGHLNIGAGRIVYQDFQKINVSIQKKEIDTLPNILKIINYCKKNNKPLHLIGLYSEGGVHSHSEHFKAIINIAESHQIKEIYLHLFTDGRDCDPKSGANLIKELELFLTNKNTKIASIIGRFYAMDRDNRWERIAKAYNLLRYGQGEITQNPSEFIKQKYENEQTDEFLDPIITHNFKAIEEEDAVFCINFRTDRCREISEALTQTDIPDFHMSKISLFYSTMTNYNKNFKNINVIFEKDIIQNSLGEVLSKNNKKQLRMAETEKYPHVTFFFSGGREAPFEGEDRFLAPSPKVKTYDLKPEMSAFEIKEALVNYIEDSKQDCIIVNFANADMVGHTGDFNAAVKAVQSVDQCLETIIPLAIEKNYKTLIIADHGNSDCMINEDGTPNTAHTTNLVPIIGIAPEIKDLKNGKLADVAPTILKLMNLDIPSEMSGNILF
jgi:2,3-bisphosphoglycerate-independent phosphoglycerate mutase